MEKRHSDRNQQETEPEAREAAQEELEQEIIENPEARIKELEEALDQKQKECATNWEKFLRERADLENYRKRVQKEKDELVKFGNENIILEILPAVDNMERALAHVTPEECQSAVIEGVKMTLSMLQSSLKKFNVTPVESKGVPFDPMVHHAMSQVETSEFPPNTVIDELQRGYLLNDRLLRPAMVTVAVAPQKKGE